MYRTLYYALKIDKAMIQSIVFQGFIISLKYPGMTINKQMVIKGS